MSDQNILTQALTNTLISRRTFLKWSAVLGGTAALASGGLNGGLQQVAEAAKENGVLFSDQEKALLKELGEALGATA